MEFTNTNQTAALTGTQRAPLYASLWLALFVTLRDEFRLARNLR